MMAPFEMLAVELMDLIFEQCDKSTLQSARLTCRSFVPTVNPHLFEKVRVSLVDTVSTDRFIKVAADPGLARCVKHLEVALAKKEHMSSGVTTEITTWYQMCVYLEPRLPESDNWMIAYVGRRPWPHCRNPMKPTIQAVFHAVEQLQNIRTVSTDSLYRSDCSFYDPTMNVFMLALSRRLRGADCFRKGLSVKWGRVSQRHFVNIWERQQMRRAHRQDTNDHPIPILGMIKHLELHAIQHMTRPTHRGFADDDEEAPALGVCSRRRAGIEADIDDDYDPKLCCDQLRLSSLCSQEANSLESLRLDFAHVPFEATRFKDDLRPWKGFSLSPRLTKVTLARLITTGDTLLGFLRHVSPTLRDLALESIYLLPCNAKFRQDVTIVRTWIREHDCSWVLARHPIPPDVFWERVLFEMRGLFASSPLSSFHVDSLTDTVGDDYHGGYVMWNRTRTFVDICTDDDIEGDDTHPGAFVCKRKFFRHHLDHICNYVLGREESLPPLDHKIFRNKHAQEGCVYCQETPNVLFFPLNEDGELVVSRPFATVPQAWQRRRGVLA